MISTTSYHKFFINLLFICCALFVSSQAYAIDDAQLLRDYQVFEAYHKQLETALAEINSKTAQNEIIDWLGIAERLGIPPTSGDDVLARINEMLGYSSDIVNGVNDSLAKNNKTLEECLSAGAECDAMKTPKGFKKYLENSSSSLTQIKIDSIKNRAGNYIPDPNLRPVNDTPTNFFDVSYMLSALSAQIPALIKFVKALSWVCGICLVMIGMLKLKGYSNHNNGGQHVFGPALAYLVVGMVLVYFPSMFYATTATLFGMGGGDSVLSYEPETLEGFGFAALTTVAIAIVRLVGYIAFFRGWLMVVKLGSPNAQQGVLSKGLVHIIGGVLAINIVSTWEVLRATFGYAW